MRNQKTTKNQKKTQGKSSPVLTNARTQNKRKIVINAIDPKPQKRSPKSRTGAFYNDGFDCVNPIIKPSVRYEDFDETCLSAVNGSTAFAISRIPLNPGQSTFFPRISKFAVLYERYKFIKLEFYFQHDVSQFATQGAQGLVVLSALFDAEASSPVNKQQLEMTNPHVICMPNQNSLLRLDSERLHPRGYPLFVRPGIVPGNTDVKTYDAGNVFIATQGMVNATEVGELHCRGTVAFYDEIVADPPTTLQLNNSLNMYSVIGVNVPGAGSTNIVWNILDFAGISGVTLPPSFTITLPRGNYLVKATAEFTATSSGALGYSILLRTTNPTTTVLADRSAGFTLASDSYSLETFVQSTGDATATTLSLQAYSQAIGAGTVAVSAKIIIQAI